jgi:hypothetical protein
MKYSPSPGISTTKFVPLPFIDTQLSLFYRNDRNLRWILKRYNVLNPFKVLFKFNKVKKMLNLEKNTTESEKLMAIETLQKIIKARV